MPRVFYILKKYIVDAAVRQRGGAGRRGFTVSRGYNREVRTSTVIVRKTDWLARIISRPPRRHHLPDLPLPHPLALVFSSLPAEALLGRKEMN